MNEKTVEKATVSSISMEAGDKRELVQRGIERWGKKKNMTGFIWMISGIFLRFREWEDIYWKELRQCVERKMYIWSCEFYYRSRSETGMYYVTMVALNFHRWLYDEN